MAAYGEYVVATVTWRDGPWTAAPGSTRRSGTGGLLRATRLEGSRAVAGSSPARARWRSRRVLMLVELW